jgi:hypothetical protein
MRADALLVVTAAILSVPTTFAIGRRPRTASPRVVGLDLQKKEINNPLNHDRSRRSKRAQTVSETLDNEETLYFANVTLGTPAQKLRLHLDTGSSDLWVNSASSTFCEQATNLCGVSGTYDSSSSSTYQFLSNKFNISYLDGTGAAGDYATDVLAIGGQTLSNFQFGIGQTSSSTQGVLGIGYPSNEVAVNRLGQSSYPNLPEALVNASLIASPAYSLWLNDLSASTGSILFGGVNAAKYTGSLQSVPIIKEAGAYYEFIIALTGISIGSTSLSSSSLPAAVLLDSGSSLTYLPNDLAAQIYSSVSAIYNYDLGAAYVACDLRSNSSSISFSFSSTSNSISVAMKELVLDAGTSSSGQPYTLQDGAPACIFGIAPSTDGSMSVLGDTFLRSAYVVYDMANNEISLAQTDFDSTESDDVREISGTVPGATAVTGGGARLGGSTSTNGIQISGAEALAVPGQVAWAMAAMGVLGVVMAAL